MQLGKNDGVACKLNKMLERACTLTAKIRQSNWASLATKTVSRVLESAATLVTLGAKSLATSLYLCVWATVASAPTTTTAELAQNRQGVRRYGVGLVQDSASQQIAGSRAKILPASRKYGDSNWGGTHQSRSQRTHATASFHVVSRVCGLRCVVVEPNQVARCGWKTASTVAKCQCSQIYLGHDSCASPGLDDSTAG